jgi:hypothetical protein
MKVPHYACSYIPLLRQNVLSISFSSRLGGVKVSVLAIRRKVLWFTPGWGDGFLGAIKNRSTPSFGGEVKSEVPCRKITRHVKYHLQMIMNKILRKAEVIVPFAHSSTCYQMTLLVGLWGSSGGRIRSFSDYIIPPWFSMHIYRLGDEQLTRWWPQFTDVVSFHQHDHHKHP